MELSQNALSPNVSGKGLNQKSLQRQLIVKGMDSDLDSDNEDESDEEIDDAFLVMSQDESALVLINKVEKLLAERRSFMFSKRNAKINKWADEAIKSRDPILLKSSILQLNDNSDQKKVETSRKNEKQSAKKASKKKTKSTLNAEKATSKNSTNPAGDTPGADSKGSTKQGPSYN